MADGGTIFLDEVGEIPLDLQSKLLRVIQEGTYERIGDEKNREVNVRIIAATNRQLMKSVEEGKFRQDLYYRLNVFPIEVPPLRKRKEDIPLLADQFLKLFSRTMNRAAPRLTWAQVMQLQHYEWPGNVRELQNVLERSAILSGSGKLRFDFPVSGFSDDSLFSPAMKDTGPVDQEVIPYSDMKRRERENIIQALKSCRWKVAGPEGAAAALGIKPTTLASKIKKFQIKKFPPGTRERTT